MYYKEWLKRKREKEIDKKRAVKAKLNLFDVIVKSVATGIFIFSLILNLILIAVLSFMIAGKTEISQGKEKIRYVKEYIKGNSKNKWEFVVLDLKGIINNKDTREGFTYRESTVSAIKNRIDVIKKNSRVKAVIVLIDSPGGTVTASDMIYKSIEELKSKKNIPVVSYIEDIGASGAYYVASATDLIAAYPTAVTGSIGVIMYNFNVRDLMNKYGVRYVVIKSGKHKDLLSPFKNIDKEEIEWMQGIVDELLERFINIVDKSRKNLSRKEVKKLADGRIYTSNMALKNGLIDFVGSFDDLLKKLQKMTGINDYSVVRYVRERQLGGVFDFLNQLAGGSKLLNLKKELLSQDTSTIKAYYIFEPVIFNHN